MHKYTQFIESKIYLVEIQIINYKKLKKNTQKLE